jgi:hypothetical protein
VPASCVRRLSWLQSPRRRRLLRLRVAPSLCPFRSRAGLAAQQTAGPATRAPSSPLPPAPHTHRGETRLSLFLCCPVSFVCFPLCVLERRSAFAFVAADATDSKQQQQQQQRAAKQGKTLTRSAGARDTHAQKRDVAERGAAGWASLARPHALCALCLLLLVLRRLCVCACLSFGFRVGVAHTTRRNACTHATHTHGGEEHTGCEGGYGPPLPQLEPRTGPSPPSSSAPPRLEARPRRFSAAWVRRQIPSAVCRLARKHLRSATLRLDACAHGGRQNGGSSCVTKRPSWSAWNVSAQRSAGTEGPWG